MEVDFRFVSPCVFEETKTENSFSRLSDKKLSYSCYENATIVPSLRFIDAGVIDSTGCTITEGAFMEFCQVRNISTSETVQYKDDVVIYLGILHNVWGHCLIDAFKKLWFLHTDVCSQLVKQGAKLVYLLPDNEDLRPYAIHLYKKADVEIEELTSVRQPTKFRNVIIPDNSIIGSISEFGQWRFYYTQDFADIYKTIRKNLSEGEKDTPHTYKKVYLTRSGINTRGREFGEKSIETVFRKQGFKIIAPEKYTLEQQYHILNNCEELAVTEGSISHTAVFCRPGTRLYLLRKSYYVNGYQVIFNELANLKVTYIDAHRSLPEVQYGAMYGPFYMCITPELERFVGHRIPHLPLWMRPSWWWYRFHNRKVVHWIARIFRIPYF